MQEFIILIWVRLSEIDIVLNAIMKTLNYNKHHQKTWQ